MPSGVFWLGSWRNIAISLIDLGTGVLSVNAVYDNYRSHLLRDAEERAARTSSGSSVISDRQRVVLPSSTLLHHPPTLTMCF
jgi:hypothetical protein